MSRPELATARNGRDYRAAVLDVLANSDLCHICGHHGAQTGDHIITVKEWLQMHGTLDGVNDPANIAPAHGTKGRDLNPCHECITMGRNGLCNQSRGAKSLLPETRSRDW